MEKFKHGTFREVAQTWIVLFGEDRVSDRQSTPFVDQDKAWSFLMEKEAEGLQVDLFVETKTVETKRLTD